MYEYVSKREVQPVKNELDNILRKAAKYLKKKYKFSFEPQLIGSGKLRLITRVVGGNCGFDFDYNLAIDNVIATSIDAKAINDGFIDVLRNVLKGSEYKDPEDSTSVLTIKVVDKENKKIIHSCDLAVVYYDENGYQYYLHNHKNGKYGFQKRRNSKNIDEKVKYIRQNRAWNTLRFEYLKLKNENKDDNKRSFSLYCEAVNNVYKELYNRS